MMARNQITLDTSGLEAALARLARIEQADAKKTVEDALAQIGEEIQQDTEAAIQPANLPAHSKYSSGDTAASVVKGAKVTWNNGVGEIPIGFDFNRPGAGGFLITGTPRMAPDKALQKIFKQKRYMDDKKKELADLIWDHILNEEGV